MFHQFLAAAPCFSMSVPCSGWQEGHSGQGSHQFPAFIHMLTTGSWLLGELYFLTFICGAFHLATDFSLSMLIFLTGLAVAQCLKMQKRELQAAVHSSPVDVSGAGGLLWLSAGFRRQIGFPRLPCTWPTMCVCVKNPSALSAGPILLVPPLPLCPAHTTTLLLSLSLLSLFPNFAGAQCDGKAALQKEWMKKWLLQLPTCWFVVQLRCWCISALGSFVLTWFLMCAGD